jgi:Rha family phage regulatory protein
MTNAIQVIVTNNDNKLTTTSKNIAEVFGKLHKNVIQSIENLECDLPTEWHRLNFQPMLTGIEIGNGAIRQDKAYQITRDGFTLLAMGFTGKKALAFKLAYIDAFNNMADALQTKPTLPPQPKIKPANRREDLPFVTMRPEGGLNNFVIPSGNDWHANHYLAGEHVNQLWAGVQSQNKKQVDVANQGLKYSLNAIFNL